MSKAITVVDIKKRLPAKLDEVFSELDPETEAQSLVEGAGMGFPTLSIRGKEFTARMAEETISFVDRDDEPVRGLDVVILRSRPNFSKTYYDGDYVEGSEDPPDCSSNDGVRPMPDSPMKQAELCKDCEKNQWGSGFQGRGKACRDNRGIIVMPVDPYIEGEEPDYPALFMRIPPASLTNLAKFGRQLKGEKLRPQSVVVRLSFERNKDGGAIPYPKLAFTAIGGIDEDMIDPIVEHLNNPDLSAMLEQASLTVGQHPDDRDVPIEDEEDEEPAPKRSSRKKAKAEPEPEEEDDEDEPDSTPVQRARSRSQARRAATKPAPEPEEDELDEEDEPEEKPAPKRRRGSRRAAAKPAPEPDDDLDDLDDDDDEEDEEPAPRRARGSRKANGRAAPKKAKAPEPEEDDEDTDDDIPRVEDDLDAELEETLGDI